MALLPLTASRQATWPYTQGSERRRSDCSRFACCIFLVSIAVLVSPSGRGFAVPLHGLALRVASTASNSGGTAQRMALLGGSRGAARRGPQEARQKVRCEGWGDPVDFFDAEIEDNTEAAEGFRFITINAPPEVVEKYTRPGQYVQAKPGPDAKPSFFAVSSPPGGKPEFLIKVAPSNEWLLNSKKSDAVLLSAAMGNGFPVDGEAWKDGGVSQVGIFATGSGIAPIRSVIESGALKGKATRLYYGTRTRSGTPFLERFAAWTKQNSVEVVPVLSKPEADWKGRTGYVQEAFKEDEEKGEGFVLASKHGALLCGQKEMANDVRDIYASLSVPSERLLTNF